MAAPNPVAPRPPPLPKIPPPGAADDGADPKIAALPAPKGRAPPPTAAPPKGGGAPDEEDGCPKALVGIVGGAAVGFPKTPVPAALGAPKPPPNAEVPPNVPPNAPPPVEGPGPPAPPPNAGVCCVDGCACPKTGPGWPKAPAPVPAPVAVPNVHGWPKVVPPVPEAFGAFEFDCGWPTTYTGTHMRLVFTASVPGDPPLPSPYQSQSLCFRQKDCPPSGPHPQMDSYRISQLLR